jgi:hypothetical protein
VKKLAGEAAALDEKLSDPDLSDVEKKKLTSAREERATEAARINERTAAFKCIDGKVESRQTRRDR